MSSFACVARRASMAHAVERVATGGGYVVIGIGTPGEAPVRLDLIEDREIVARGSACP